ncbi:hypothetical protein [Kribbella lupini]|uniref:Uncharacterized protein n=1 Tax=Kribbella lupini TaxID=291602 RepID=A0ABP4NAJ9_9ACTN
MANSDEVFLATDEPIEVVAARVAEVLGLTYLGQTNGRFQYTRWGRVFDGWIGVYVGVNDFWPEPGEVQAMDLYPVRVEIQSRRRDGRQAEEARLAFEFLVEGLPEVPALLSRNLEVLVAASRPGVGTHYFGENVWLDPPEIEPWRPWVLLADE